MKELSNELAAAIRPLEMKLKLLWIGVFPAFAIYMFLAWKIAQNGQGRTTAPSMLWFTVFLGLQVLLVSLVFRWFILSPRAIARVLNGRQPFLIKLLANPGSASARASRNQEVLERLEGDERTLYEYSGCLFTVMFISWGMVNTCALFGMILPPAAYQPPAAIVAGLASAACMLFHYPNIQNTFAAGLELAEFEQGRRVR